MKQYILTDGNANYIRLDKPTNRYVQVGLISSADTWESFEKAEKIRKSRLGKDLKRKYYCISIEVPDSKVKETAPAKPKIADVMEGVKAVNDEKIEKTIIDFLRCAETLFAKKDDLIAKQSAVDKEVTDLQHYIEQKNLNAYEGYMAYKRLQGILVKRRSIKDELLILKIIESCKMEPDSISKTISRIQGLNGRKYAPRVLTELFDNVVRQ